MKLVELADQYRILNENMQLVEETTHMLKQFKPNYCTLAEQLHSGLEQRLGQKLPKPKDIDSSLDYAAYRTELMDSVKQHYGRLKSKQICKGDRVRIVRAARNPYRYKKDEYYYGTKVSEISLNTEWKVNTVVTDERVTSDYYDTNTVYKIKSYVLDTKKVLGRNAKFHRLEVEKITRGIPATIEEFLQGFCADSASEKVTECLKSQMQRTPMRAVQKCVYSIGISIFPEYRSTLRKEFPEMQ